MASHKVRPLLYAPNVLLLKLRMMFHLLFGSFHLDLGASYLMDKDKIFETLDLEVPSNETINVANDRNVSIEVIDIEKYLHGNIMDVYFVPNRVVNLIPIDLSRRFCSMTMRCSSWTRLMMLQLLQKESQM